MTGFIPRTLELTVRSAYRKTILARHLISYPSLGTITTHIAIILSHKAKKKNLYLTHERTFVCKSTGKPLYCYKIVLMKFPSVNNLNKLDFMTSQDL